MQSDAVAQVLHDVVAVSPETDDQAGAAEGENPGGDLGLALRGERTIMPDLENSSIGSDGVGNIIGSVGERSSSGGHDLEEAVHVLGFVVVVGSMGVELLDVTGEDILAVLHVDDILIDTAEESVLDIPEEDVALIPRSLRLGADNLLDWGRLGSAIVRVG